MRGQRRSIETPRTPRCSASLVMFGAARLQYRFPQRRKAAKKESFTLAPKASFKSLYGASRQRAFFAALRLCGKRLGIAAAMVLLIVRQHLGVLGVSTLQRGAS